MGYDDKSVYEIVINYALLKESLKELEDIKKEKNGVVFAYATQYYNSAEKAIEFLQSIPDSLQERLRLGDLEKELHNFANTHIKL